MKRLSTTLTALLLAIGAVTAQPPQAAIFYEKGLELYRRGEMEAAVREMQRAVALRPDYPEAHNALGLLLGKKGADIETVVFHFRKAIQLRPAYAQAHHNLGLVLAQVGRIDECIKEFRAAIAADGNDPDPYNSLALTLVERNVDDAIDLYKQAIALKPDFVEAQFNLALAYRRKFGTEREMEQLKKVLALDEHHLVARNTLTRRYEELGQYEEVARLAEETLRFYPDSGEAHYFAGKALLKAGDAGEGLDHLRQAIRLEPSLAEAHYHLSLILRKQRMTAEADQELARSEELREKQHRDISASIQMSQATVSMERGDLDKATHALREVVKSQPEWPDAHWRLAYALLRSGNREEAAAGFERAIALDSNYFDAHYLLGLIRLQQGKAREGRLHLEKAVQLRKNSPDALRALGGALALEGAFAPAESYYRAALKLRPEDPATLYPLAQVLKDQKKLTEARRFQKQADQISAPAKARGEAIAAMDEGQRKLQSGDLDGAIEAFRRSSLAQAD